MCGIVGFINRKKHGYNSGFDKAFADLKWINQMRGVHGSGVLTVDTNGKQEIFKSPGCYETLASNKKYQDKMFTFDSKRFVVGHDRFATSGKIDLDHTHPFKVGNITLVHNGTLREYPKFVGVEMDSLAVTHAVNELGIEETINKIEGAYALVWFNKSDNTLHFLRNIERPMFFIHAPDHEGIFFASEPFMAMTAMVRHNIKWKDIEELKPHTEYTFDLDGGEGRSRELIKKAVVLPTVDTTILKEGGVPCKDDGLVRKKITIGAGIAKDHLEFLSEKWLHEGDVPVSYACDPESIVSKIFSDPILPSLSYHQGLRPSESKVIPFSKKDRVSPVNPVNNITGLAKFKLGQEIRFSLDSVEAIRAKSTGAIEQNTIFGLLPAPFKDDYIIRGQTGMAKTFLTMNDSLYVGTIMSFMYNKTQEKYIIFVRDISLSSLKDPNKKTEWEVYYKPEKLLAQPIFEPLRERQLRYKDLEIEMCDDCNGWYKPHDLVDAGSMVKQCLNCMDREGLNKETPRKTSVIAVPAVVTIH